LDGYSLNPDPLARSEWHRVGSHQQNQLLCLKCTKADRKFEIYDEKGPARTLQDLECSNTGLQALVSGDLNKGASTVITDALPHQDQLAARVTGFGGKSEDKMMNAVDTDFVRLNRRLYALETSQTNALELR
jgi:hypothetical protein